MISADPANAAEARKHVKGATIAWGGGKYFDFENPHLTDMVIEDYAYAIAYTVRWRGQTRSRGQRCFFGVGQHCVHGAEQMLRDGHGKAKARQFLTHESDEVPFPDIPGPCKPLMPDAIAVVKRCGDAVDAHFGHTFPDRDLVKRYDIRMLVTERRDLLGGHEAEIWTNGGSGLTSTEGFEPFEERIIPYRHPDLAARRWLQLYHELAA